MYLWECKEWPNFVWDEHSINEKLIQLRHEQGRLLGMADHLGFDTASPVVLESMTADIIKSSEIEGVLLNADDVRSSVAWQLGLDQVGVPSADRYVEGVVDVMFDAVHHYDSPLSEERLFGWYRALFPSPSRLLNLAVGSYRVSDVPMQVVSGRYGHEKIHYEAPPSSEVPSMMADFIRWINESNIDPMLKASVAHLWFVTIHPFGDGNGRLARTITDMQLAKSDGTPLRFYSMWAQIASARKAYYDILERTQKGSMDITAWIVWFLGLTEQAIRTAIESVHHTLRKAGFWEAHRHIAMNERQTRMVNLMWDGFEGKLTSSKWAKINKCSADTALRDIQDLVAKGILVRSNEGGRSTGYELTEAER